MEIDEKKLKPCPFCGGQAVIGDSLIRFSYSNRKVTAHCVKCSKCLASTNDFLEDELSEEQCVDRAIKFWNRRKNLSLETKTSDNDVTDTNVGKWIPCSEMLPNKEQDTDVLVTYFDKLTGKKWVDKECYFYGVWVATLNEFETRLAWMPLPEAYKGEE